jgi:GLPGLI family protein
MKKRLFLAAVLMSAFCSAKAQKTDTAQVLVHYKFTHVRDTTNRSNPYTENMVLFIGKTASSYKSYDGQLQDALFKKQLAAQKASSPDGRVNMSHSSTASATSYYLFTKEQKLFTKEWLFNSYLIESPIPSIKWKIARDTASFAGLHCQKATGYFKGRDYIVWFCPDLPVRTGPWKLSGLPGTIIEAYDTKKDVVFKFDGLEKAVLTPQESKKNGEENKNSGGSVTLTVGMNNTDADPNIIELPAKAIRTNQREFDKLQETMRKDPDAFAQSMMAGQGVSSQGGTQHSVVKIKVAPGPVINNPIELPEKK